MQQSVTAAPAQPTRARSGNATMAALCAAGLGLFLVWGVGFWPLPAVHDAAHDTRHSIGFPCH